MLNRKRPARKGEMKHTPGPWRVEAHKDADDCDVYGIFTIAGGMLILADDDGPEDIANLKLMAAAPEILGVLRDAVKCKFGWHARAKALLAEQENMK